MNYSTLKFVATLMIIALPKRVRIFIWFKIIHYERHKKTPFLGCLYNTYYIFLVKVIPSLNLQLFKQL